MLMLYCLRQCRPSAVALLRHGSRQPPPALRGPAGMCPIGIGSGARAFKRVHAQRRRTLEEPRPVIAEYLEFLREEIGAERRAVRQLPVSGTCRRQPRRWRTNPCQATCSRHWGSR